MKYKEQFTEHLEDCIKETCRVYDRFSFDRIFRKLLQDGYDHEEAKDIIIHNFALSTLVMQERIYNSYYLKISADGQISNDLLELADEISNKYFRNRLSPTKIIFICQIITGNQIDMIAVKLLGWIREVHPNHLRIGTIIILKTQNKDTLRLKGWFLNAMDRK